MNGIKNSFKKVFLFIGFQVLMSSLVCFSQAVDSIDKDDLQSEKVIKAPMPGRLTKVHVQKGQEVKVGDVLYIIEAMKMEMTVHSPFSGEIKDIHFRASDIVDGNCTIISFTPPFVERSDMNQAPNTESKDTSITLVPYVTDTLSSASNHAGSNLPGSIPSEAPATESSSHESFVIKPPAPESVQNERVLRLPFARSLNCIVNEPTDDIDSNSAPVHSPDENENLRPFVDSRDYLIVLFSYALGPLPPGSSPPDSFPPRSPPKESPAKEILRKPHDPYSDSAKERSAPHANPMSPMRELQIEAPQITSNDFNVTALNWVCGSIAMCLLMIASKQVSSYRLRRSQMRIFNQIKYFHFTHMTPNRFMTKRRARNMNRVIVTKWKIG